MCKFGIMVITLGFDPRDSCSIQEICAKYLTNSLKYVIIYIESEGKKMYNNDGQVIEKEELSVAKENTKKQYIPLERRHFCFICRKELFPNRQGYDVETCPDCMRFCENK